MLTHRKLKDEEEEGENVDVEDGESISKKNIKGFRKAVTMTFTIATILIIIFLYMNHTQILASDSVKHEEVIIAAPIPTENVYTKTTTAEIPHPHQNWIDAIALDTTNHIVEPPKGNVTLVKCQTTCGIMGIAVHISWAPRGANRFLDMVQNDFFSTKVGLFRALKGFLVQFGLSGNTVIQDQWRQKGELLDDIPWLPQGPPGRKINGVKRFKRGYMAYAGAGKNSRGTQLIIAFRDDGPLGGAPWEVPFAQLVGEDSYRTLDSIYTGYDEEPSQGKIQNIGVKYLEEEFPLMDYITACDVIATGLKWTPKSSTQRTGGDGGGGG